MAAEQPKPEHRPLSQVVSKLRHRSGLTQADLADAAGVSTATIAKLELGTRGASQETRSRVAAALSMTLEELDALVDQAASIADGSADHGDIDELLDEVTPRIQAAAVSYTSSSGRRRPAQPPQPTAVRQIADALAATVDDDRLERQLGPEVVGIIQRLVSEPPDAPLVSRLLDLVTEAGIQELEAEGRQRLEALLAGLTRPGGRAGFQPLAAIPASERRYVFSTAVGIDEQGQLWLDPFAPAMPLGDDRFDPRVERYADGTIILDDSRVQQRAWGPRDPDRHVIRPIRRDPDGEADLDPLDAAYRNTILELTVDGVSYTVAPAPPGTTDGRYPEGHDRIHVITAHNPRSQLLTPAENEDRNRFLRRDLERLGCDIAECTGRSRHSDWSEASFAVFGRETDQILELARDYDQNAVFEWTPEHRRVLWVDPDHAADSHGWRSVHSPAASTA